jgi:hypothetical protein
MHATGSFITAPEDATRVDAAKLLEQCLGDHGPKPLPANCDAAQVSHCIEHHINAVAPMGGDFETYARRVKATARALSGREFEGNVVGNALRGDLVRGAVTVKDIAGIGEKELDAMACLNKLI